MTDPTKYVEEVLPCLCPNRPATHTVDCARQYRPAVERAMRRYAAAVLEETATFYQDGFGAQSMNRTQITKGLRALAARLEEDR